MNHYKTILENAYRLPPQERINGKEARLDGITFSFPLLLLSKVRTFTQNLLQAPFDYEPCRYGSRWYEFFAAGYGAGLHWQHRQGFPIGLCELKGEYFSCLDSKAQKELVDFVISIGCKPTSLALDVDDFERIYSPYWFVDQWQNAKCSGFKTWKYCRSFEPSRKHLGCGLSASFGRRGNVGGQKFFCAYDKNVESDGALNCYRYEMTLYKQKAFDAVKRLAFSPLSDWHSLISSVIQGEAKFKNFIISDSSIKLASKKPKNCLYAKSRWIHRQIPLVYAALNQAYSDVNSSISLHDALVAVGEKNPKYQTLVSAFRNLLFIDGITGPQDDPLG